MKSGFSQCPACGALEENDKLATSGHECQAPVSNLSEEPEVVSPYDKRYAGILFDPYRIFAIYGITNGPQQHAIKKLLRAAADQGRVEIRRPGKSGRRAATRRGRRAVLTDHTMEPDLFWILIAFAL